MQSNMQSSGLQFDKRFCVIVSSSFSIVTLNIIVSLLQLTLSVDYSLLVLSLVKGYLKLFESFTFVVHA